MVYPILAVALLMSTCLAAPVNKSTVVVDFCGTRSGCGVNVTIKNGNNEPTKDAFPVACGATFRDQQGNFFRWSNSQLQVQAPCSSGFETLKQISGDGKCGAYSVDLCTASGPQ